MFYLTVWKIKTRQKRKVNPAYSAWSLDQSSLLKTMTWSDACQTNICRHSLKAWSRTSWTTPPTWNFSGSTQLWSVSALATGRRHTPTVRPHTCSEPRKFTAATVTTTSALISDLSAHFPTSKSRKLAGLLFQQLCSEAPSTACGCLTVTSKEKASSKIRNHRPLIPSSKLSTSSGIRQSWRLSTSC